MEELIRKAGVLHEALPYIRRLHGRTVVVKYGGHAMVDAALRESFARDIVVMRYVGIQVIVVHGGGPQIDHELEVLGVKSERIDGLRVTDDRTMEVVEMVLGGRLNHAIVSLINQFGGRAIGLKGHDDSFLRGTKVKQMRTKSGNLVDPGRVGENIEVRADLLKELVKTGYIPVVAPIAVDHDGRSLNVNADTIAGAVAQAVHAEKLVLMTDIEGVKGAGGELLTSLTAADVSKLKDAGVIAGGMIPKVDCALDAVRGGTSKVHIIDGRVRHALLLEVFTDEGVGTEIPAVTKSRNETLIETAKTAQLGNYRPAPIVLTEGKGVRVRDADGREYLDFAGGLAVTSVGHAHPKLQRAISEQAGRLLHVSNLFYNDKQIALASELTKRTGFARVFFCNSGTEANEAMLKLARRHHFASGQPERTGFVSTIHSFHGRTFGALSVTGQPKYHEGMAPLVPGVTFVPYDDLPAMAAAVGETTAAVIVEPIQAEGGLFVPSAGYLRGLRELCDQRGALLLFDEVQTGFGRTGTFMGAEHAGVRPDACSLAKGIAGGFPLGAMLASEKVAAALVPGTHASTFGGNPLACAAALSVLEIFDEERLVANCAERGTQLADGLDALVTQHRAVVERRGRGLLQGVLLADDVDPARALEKCREHGLLVTLAGGRVIRLSPALTVNAAEVREALGMLSAVLAELSKELPS